MLFNHLKSSTEVCLSDLGNGLMLGKDTIHKFKGLSLFSAHLVKGPVLSNGWAGAHVNLCMLCTAFFKCLNFEFVGSTNTINMFYSCEWLCG